MNPADQLKARIPIAFDPRGEYIYPNKEFILMLQRIFENYEARIKALEEK